MMRTYKKTDMLLYIAAMGEWSMAECKAVAEKVDSMLIWSRRPYLGLSVLEDMRAGLQRSSSTGPHADWEASLCQPAHQR